MNKWLVVLICSCGGAPIAPAQGGTAVVPSPAPSASASVAAPTPSVSTSAVPTPSASSDLCANNSPIAQWSNIDCPPPRGEGIGLDAHESKPVPTQTGVMRQGQVGVTGGLPREVVERIVRMSFGRFRKCWDDARQRDPNIGGQIVVGFEIDDKGMTKSATTQKTDLPAPMAACITRAISTIVFAQPQGTVVVEYPLYFRP